MYRGEILLHLKKFSIYTGSREVQFEHLYVLTPFHVQ